MTRARYRAWKCRQGVHREVCSWCRDCGVHVRGEYFASRAGDVFTLTGHYAVNPRFRHTNAVHDMYLAMNPNFEIRVQGSEVPS